MKRLRGAVQRRVLSRGLVILILALAALGLGGALAHPASTRPSMVNYLAIGPFAFPQTYPIDEDTVTVLEISAADSDLNELPISFSIDSPPSHGSLGPVGLPNCGSFLAVYLCTAQVTYTPATDYNGSDSFVFQATNQSGATSTAAITMDIRAVNDPPIPGPDSRTTLEDTLLSFLASALVGDDVPGPATATDESGQALTVESVAATANTHGTVSLDGGMVTYTPAANYNGTASFTYHICDNGTPQACADGTVSVTVTAVNDPPSFTKGPSQTVAEDSGPRTMPGWATAISPGPPDEVGQTLSFLVSNNNPSLFASQPAVAANGTLTFQPAAGAAGSATVTVRLKDNGGTANGGLDTSPPQTFTITVSAVDDPPVATNPGNQNSLEGASVRLRIQASDPDTAPLTYSATGLPAGLNIGPHTGLIAGTIAYTAAGSHTVTVSVSDGATTRQVGFTWKVADVKLTQTIDFPAPTEHRVGDAPFTVTATASSKLTVSLSASGPCRVSGNTVTLSSAGTCTLTATQPGNEVYLAAPPVARSFQVTPAATVVTARQRLSITTYYLVLIPPSPPPSPSVSATPETIAASEAVTITGSNFAAGEELRRWLISPDGTRYDYTQPLFADNSGSFERILGGEGYIFPPPGRYEYHVVGSATQQETVASFTVADSQTRAASLPSAVPRERSGGLPGHVAGSPLLGRREPLLIASPGTEPVRPPFPDRRRSAITMAR